MNQKTIQINAQPIGVGQERICYPHPDEPSRVVKIQRGKVNRQTRRELEFYRILALRNMTNYAHLPRFYGEVQTSLGPGFVVDRIQDFDGGESRSLWWYFKQGYPVSEFYPYLEDLRLYLLDNLIVFNVDMGRYNLLFSKKSPEQARLIVIDGLGNHSAINWLDNITLFARRKINRRWHRFFTRLQNYSAQMVAQNPAAPRQLDANYRRETCE